MSWNIVYLDSVDDWLKKLDKAKLKSLAKELRLLELCGSELRLPHSRSLGTGLFELRERNFGLRIYYCYEVDITIVILCGGDKKSQQRDISKARELLDQYRK